MLPIIILLGAVAVAFIVAIRIVVWLLHAAVLAIAVTLLLVVLAWKGLQWISSRSPPRGTRDEPFGR